jgi:hypothetical protein
MKMFGALVALLVVNSASAFSLGMPRITPRSTTQLFAFRQTYQYQLDENTGNVNINGCSFDTEDAIAQIAADLKESQAAGVEAASTFSELEAQLRAKEQQQEEIATTMKEAME